MLKKLFTAVGISLVLVSAASAQTKVKFGLVGATNEAHIPVLVAIDQGYFKEEKIQPEIEYFRGGGIAVQALVGGSIDLAAFATDHVLRLNNRGIDTKILAGIDRFITYTFVSLTSKGYKDITSLKGKKIGVTAPGSYTDNLIRWEIKKAGLDPDRDFTIVGIGTGQAAQAGLETGQVDAIAAATPDILKMQQDNPNKFHILIDYRKIPYSGQAIIGKNDWIKSNPEAARAVTRAILKAEKKIQTDPAAVEHVVRKQFPEANDAFVKALSKEIPKLLLGDGKVSTEGFANMIDVLKSVEPELKPIKLSDVDLTSSLSGK